MGSTADSSYFDRAGCITNSVSVYWIMVVGLLVVVVVVVLLRVLAYFVLLMVVVFILLVGVAALEGTRV